MIFVKKKPGHLAFLGVWNIGMLKSKLVVFSGFCRRHVRMMLDHKEISTLNIFHGRGKKDHFGMTYDISPTHWVDALTIYTFHEEKTV